MAEANNTFDVSPPKRPKRVRKEETTEVLVLAPFHPVPKICFENIKVNSEAKRKLLLKNPAFTDLKVSLLDSIPTERGLTLSFTESYLGAGEETTLEITWVPTKAGAWTRSIPLRTSSPFKANIVVSCTSVDGNKAKTRPLTSKNAVKTVRKSKVSVPVNSLERRRSLTGKVPSSSAHRRQTFLVGKENKTPVKKQDKIHSHLDLTSKFEAFVLSPLPLNAVPNNFNVSDLVCSPTLPTFNLNKEPHTDLPDCAVASSSLRRTTYGVKQSCVSTVAISISHPSPPSDEFYDSLNEIKEDDLNAEKFQRKVVSYENDFDDTSISFNLAPPADDPKRCSTGIKRHKFLTLTKSLEERESALPVPNFGNPLSTETYMVTRDFRHNSQDSIKEHILGSHSCREDLDYDDEDDGVFQPLAVSPPQPAGKDIQPPPRRLIKVPTELKKSVAELREEKDVNSTPDLPRRKSVMQKSTRQVPPVRSKALGCTPKSAALKLALKRTPRSANVQSKSVFLFDATSIFSEGSKRDPLSAGMTKDPFLNNMIFCGDQFVATQEKNMVNWMNALLTPPIELEHGSEVQTINITELWNNACRRQAVELAPSKEVVSSDVYDKQSRLASLRRAAEKYLMSEEITQVLCKVDTYIDKKLIAIREDREVHIDVGLKHNVLELLLSYNPLWLRIGLEAIYGRTVPMKNNSDVVGVATFIAQNLLNDSDIVAVYSHPNVPHLKLPGFREAMNKFILKKFLMLVFFLDRAKTFKLISHDPCLFLRQSKYKCSKDILTTFARDLLSGVGDIVRLMQSWGYTLSVKQGYLDEFEFALKSLQDLRDGVRLTRIMELILCRHGLLEKLRVPVISKLQKIHNVDVALQALAEAGYTLYGDIQAKNIVEGHQEKTLSFLWQLIYKFQSPIFIQAANRIQIWWRSRLIMIRIRRMNREKKRAVRDAAAKRIQSWWRSQKAQKRLVLLQEATKAHLLARQSAALVLQKHWRRLCALQRFRKAQAAATTIQKWYRGAVLTRNLRSDYLTKVASVVKIQALVRGFQTRQRFAELRRTAAALRIQTWFRKLRSLRLIVLILPTVRAWQKEREARLSACVKIQRRFRGLLLMKQDRAKYEQVRSSAIIIQRRFRAYRAMKVTRRDFLTQKKAALTIQRKYRVQMEMRMCRTEFLAIKCATVVLQQRFRAQLEMKKCRVDFLAKRNAAMVFQQRYRAQKLMKENLQEYKILKKTVIQLQIRYRAKKLMMVHRVNYLKLRSATICIQRKWRATLAMKSQKTQFSEVKSSLVVIQRKWRATLLARKARCEFVQQREAAVKIQRKWRATLMMRKQRLEYLEQRCSARTIQRWFRACLENRQIISSLERQHAAATTIQKLWRGYIVRKRMTDQLMNAKQRCDEAAENARPENRVGQKLKSLTAQLGDECTPLSLGKWILACTALENILKASPESCIAFAKSSYLGRLLQLPFITNRSESSRALTLVVIRCLLQLAKFDRTFPLLWEEIIQTDSLSPILFLLKKWNGKDQEVFMACATFFWVIVAKSHSVEEIKRIPKLQETLDRLMQKKSTKNHSSNFLLPQLSPVWHMQTKNDARPIEFEDASFAVKTIILTVNNIVL